MRRIIESVACVFVACMASAFAHSTVLKVVGGAGEGIGGAVVSLGDLDGDGVPDFAMGGPLDDAGGVDAGVVRVVAGASGATLYVLHGGAAGARFGAALASVADLDGDGKRELIVGAPGSGAAAGRAFLHSGAAGASIHAFTGTSAGDGFGATVAGADLDGDGRADVVVGAPASDVAFADAGRVVAYSGNGFGALFAVDGAAAGDACGAALDAIGDFDGDGRADLVVGSPGFDAPSAPDAGIARVISGATGAVLLSHTLGYSNTHAGVLASGAGDFDVDGFADAMTCDEASLVHTYMLLGGLAPIASELATESFGNFEGRAMRAVGDVNGDGGDDVAWSRTHAALAQPAVIRIYGLEQPWGGGAGHLYDTIAEFVGPADAPDLGASLAAAGDVDRDGFADFLAGAPLAGAGAGEARVATVASPAPRRRSFAPLAEFGAGRAVAALGDVNGDSIPDAVVSGYDGAVPSQFVGRVRAISGADGSAFQLQLGTQGAEFGAALAAIGDVDGDGRSDYAVGAPLEDGAQSDVGTVRWYSGANGALLRTSAGMQKNERFGSDVRGAGDVDADGTTDVIVGSPLADVTLTDQGVARVLSGATGATLLTLKSDGASDQFGSSVAGGIDVNADGFADLVGGAPGDDGPLVDQGSVRAFSGKTGVELWVRRGNAASIQLGGSVDVTGDLDADGSGDVLAAATYSTTVLAYSGASGQTLLTVPPATTSGVGTSVRAAGDQDGDGRDDIAIGHSNTWWNGEFSGLVALHSSADGALLKTFALETDDECGRSIDSLGDLDNDGRPELVVGAPGDSPEGADEDLPAAGSASFFTSKDSGINTYGNGCPGALGFVPRLLAIGNAHPGAQLSLRLFDARAGATALLVLGTQPAKQPIGGGCRLLVAATLPPIAIPLAGNGPGKGAVKLDAVLPQPLPSIELYVQMLVLDPATSPAAASNGVRLEIH